MHSSGALLLDYRDGERYDTRLRYRSGTVSNDGGLYEPMWKSGAFELQGQLLAAEQRDLGPAAIVVTGAGQALGGDDKDDDDDDDDGGGADGGGGDDDDDDGDAPMALGAAGGVEGGAAAAVAGGEALAGPSGTAALAEGRGPSAREGGPLPAAGDGAEAELGPGHRRAAGQAEGEDGDAEDEREFFDPYHPLDPDVPGILPIKPMQVTC